MPNQVELDGRRRRGDASRRVVLASATDLASVEGLDGLSIGRLAEASRHSKSSIATLFKSKEGLQLATIAAAREIFTTQIIEPARLEPRGVRRLAVLLRGALQYSRDRVFAGGCFFLAAAADVDSKPGPVRDAVRAALLDWYAYLGIQVAHAIAVGELHHDDAEALTFELIALNEGANSRSLLTGESGSYVLAAAAMRERLSRAGADAEALALLQV